jgi:hypothetical protein
VDDSGSIMDKDRKEGGRKQRMQYDKNVTWGY